MIIRIDTYDLKERIYRMLRDIDDGKYKNKAEYYMCAGMLNEEKTAAMNELIEQIHKEAKGC